MKRRLLTGLLALVCAVMLSVSSAKPPVVAPSYSWELLPPLGLHEPSTIDTLYTNYAQRSVPVDAYTIYASTGNVGGAGIDMDYLRQPSMSDFFFRDAMAHWRPTLGNHKFYNTRIPMTLLSYNTAGGRENKQDRLNMVFSGNVNKQIQIGANLDYLYSKGSYNYQAAKNLTWGFSGSYIGDRYELQAFFNHSNGLNQDNGGITDDLYITDPAELQGGQSSINPKSIPTNLTMARTRLKGQEFYMNHRYKLGFWKVTPPNDTVPDDTIEHRTYVPVTSFIWTLDYRDGKHSFINDSPSEASDFWENQYLTTGASASPTTYRSLSNTFGVSLLEGFNKYAKAGLSAYVTHEIRRYTQCPDTLAISGAGRPELLTPYPYDVRIDAKGKQNLLWVGGQLTKQQGRLLRYEATAKIGVVGAAAGEVFIDGNVQTRFNLLGDSVAITGYGRFANETAPYLMNNYVSNYFIWHNDFSKTRRVRFGGELKLHRTGTRINVGVENIQNLIYFNNQCLPVQHGGSIQVLSATLQQNLHYRALHWDNRLIYQTSSEKDVLSLPTLALYSNLYVDFKVARVLSVQFGVDCDYYTKYYAPAYQPATMAFCNQRTTKVGNYPFMNLYANMKLRQARFYVMMSHINQGMTGKNYFAMPHYPMNPRIFQMGVSVDFAN
ncbi:MAG: putative porin [Firmicutes bacterium]|nr:putative porin [Bacillota bacterium]MCM1401704.1 putative porin [Bacteroides sp.]MCM1477962.1 putative porin [Bacteroides sp.]